MIQDRIDKIEATVTQATNLPGETRAELLKLLAELKAEVAPLTATHDEDASSIAGFAEASVHEAMRTERKQEQSEAALESWLLELRRARL